MHTGDFIFVSGQVAKNACAGNIEGETGWTIEAVRRILALEQAALPDIIKMTIFLEDAPNFGRYNQIIAEHFPEGVLARATVGVRAVIDCKIETEAIAYKPMARAKCIDTRRGRGSAAATRRTPGGRA